MKTKHHLIAFLLGSQFAFVNCPAQYSNIHTFDDSTAVGPYGTLISDGTFLYGTAAFGGTNGKGTVFKIMPDGTGYSDLFNFSGTVSGSYPYGSLIYDGTFLYGMTNEGGSSDLGTVFKIKTDGTGYVNLHNFSGNPDGSNPFGSLYYDGAFLYGTTKAGGTNNLGTIFKLTTSGTGYVTLLNFAGLSNGKDPYGTLISDGTYLYGTTSYGGANDCGTVFKILPDGTGYTQLHAFSYDLNGKWLFGSLFFDGTFLYGMTYSGGTGGYGGIFKIKTDGTGFIKLLDYNWTNGAGGYIGNSFISDGTFLYGMTSEGGQNWYGKLFKIKTDGTGYTGLVDFAGNANGSFPYGTAYSDGTFLYGMTSSGGSYNRGTIFKYNITCTPATYSWSATICAGDSVTVGTNSYSWTGTYTDIFPLVANGCDSTVITNLTVIPVDTMVAVNGFTLTSYAWGATYQWVDCGNGYTPIPGETGQSFTAALSGSYAVIVTQSGCTDTSSCRTIMMTGAAESASGIFPLVSPNPCNGQFSVTLQDNKSSRTVKITTVTGQEVFRKTFTSLNTLNIAIDEPPGLYFLSLENGNGQHEIVKIIIQ